ncbi:MAG TPA: hypothetical protein VN651_09850 [Gemmatimonadaceae bacterium]|nr:hypothetical protein [Gemmatimonadaceae bacterium]
MKAGPRLSLEALRTAIQRRVDETSLRDAADEIGMRSYTALGRFLRGETKTPHRANHDLMLRWFYRRESAPPAVQRAQVDAATSVLRAWINDPGSPKAVREARRRETLESIDKNSD